MIPIEELRTRAQEILRDGEQGPHFHTAVLLLAALVVGQSIQALVDYTDLPEEFVRHTAARLLSSGVWCGDDTVDVRWLGDNLDTIAFLLDVNVGIGDMERIAGDRYKITPQGKKRVGNMLKKKDAP